MKAFYNIFYRYGEPGKRQPRIMSAVELDTDDAQRQALAATLKRHVNATVENIVIESLVQLKTDLTIKPAMCHSGMCRRVDAGGVPGESGSPFITEGEAPS